MKLGKLVKTAMKWGPVVLPVVMKYVNDKKQDKRTTAHKR